MGSCGTWKCKASCCGQKGSLLRPSIPIPTVSMLTTCRFPVASTNGSFQKSGAHIKTPNSRALIVRTHRKTNPQFIETAKCADLIVLKLLRGELRPFVGSPRVSMRLFLSIVFLKLPYYTSSRFGIFSVEGSFSPRRSKVGMTAVVLGMFFSIPLHDPRREASSTRKHQKAGAIGHQ